MLLCGYPLPLMLSMNNAWAGKHNKSDWLCCINQCRCIRPPPLMGSGNGDTLRHTEVTHAVQDLEAQEKLGTRT